MYTITNTSIHRHFSKTSIDILSEEKRSCSMYVLANIHLNTMTDDRFEGKLHWYYQNEILDQLKHDYSSPKQHKHNIYINAHLQSVFLHDINISCVQHLQYHQQGHDHYWKCNIIFTSRQHVFHCQASDSMLQQEIHSSFPHALAASLHSWFKTCNMYKCAPKSQNLSFWSSYSSNVNIKYATKI